MNYQTYEEYCKANAIQGFQVIPQSLWNALKSDDQDEDEGQLFDCEA